MGPYEVASCLISVFSRTIYIGIMPLALQFSQWLPGMTILSLLHLLALENLSKGWRWHLRLLFRLVLVRMQTGKGLARQLRSRSLTKAC
jgi:hypothetical protein